MAVKVIAFINFKGGVGKTANVLNLGAALAKFHNKKVLIIDLDAQSNATCQGDTMRTRLLSRDTQLLPQSIDPSHNLAGQECLTYRNVKTLCIKISDESNIKMLKKEKLKS
jgi:cellulose biosynthesis protein BcsQ